MSCGQCQIPPLQKNDVSKMSNWPLCLRLVFVRLVRRPQNGQHISDIVWACLLQVHASVNLRHDGVIVRPSYLNLPTAAALSCMSTFLPTATYNLLPTSAALYAPSDVALSLPEALTSCALYRNLSLGRIANAWLQPLDGTLRVIATRPCS